MESGRWCRLCPRLALHEGEEPWLDLKGTWRSNLTIPSSPAFFNGWGWRVAGGVGCAHGLALHEGEEPWLDLKGTWRSNVPWLAERTQAFRLMVASLPRPLEASGKEGLTPGISPGYIAMPGPIGRDGASPPAPGRREGRGRRKEAAAAGRRSSSVGAARAPCGAARCSGPSAAALAHKTSNTQAIIYTYSLMANLAYIQGQLDQDDNSIIEISLKLATIYAGQNKTELAEHGYRFCTESLEAKLQQHQDSPPDHQSGESDQPGEGDQPGSDQSVSPEELRKETRLLLGLCLDSRARYRAVTRRLQQAAQDYRRALQICSEEQGETHPQSLVLMSDLATILDLQGLHDEALPLVRRAVELSREAGHPDHHVLLGNLAGILLHQGDTQAAVGLYKEALSLAQAAGDEEAAEQIHQGLMEVQKRKKEQQEKEEKEEQEEVELK
ncbi:hypothetical protein CRUP_025942 [Coryphaenoides rupestris]|nr:hypothetical protein CRUP_025942 [Coryphaenoides rupestris]